MKYSKTALRELTRLYRAVLLAAIMGTVAISGTANATSVVVGGTYDSGAGTITGGTATDLDEVYDAKGAAADAQAFIENALTNTAQYDIVANSVTVKGEAVLTTGEAGSMAYENKTNYYTKSQVDTALNGKQATLSAAQLAAANSGITADKVTAYDGYATSKQDALSDAQLAAANSGITEDKVTAYDSVVSAVNNEDTGLAATYAIADQNKTDIGTLNTNVGNVTAFTGSQTGNISNSAPGQGENATNTAAAIANIDATIGQIHGLASTIDVTAGSGNLEQGSTVSGHLLALAGAIGDRSEYATSTYMQAADTVSEALLALDDAVGDLEDNKQNLLTNANNAGNGIVITDDPTNPTIGVKLADSSGLKVDANGLAVKNGDTITVSSEGFLNIKYKATQFEANGTDGLKILAGAITSNELADNAVTADKIYAGSVTFAKLGTDVSTTAATADDTKLITSGGVYDLVNVGTAGAYITTGTGVAGNLALLDAGVKANADALDTKAGLADNNVFSGKNTFGSTTGSQVVIDNNGTITMDGVLTAKSDASVGGDLSVTGDTTLTGALAANGGITTTDLTATGDTTLANTTVGGTLEVTGDTTLAKLTAGATTLDSVEVTNNATVGGNLSVTGDTTLTGALTANGGITTTDLTATGTTTLANTTVGGTLNVTGATTLTGALTANGGITTTDLKATGTTTLANTTVDGTLNVTGDTTLAKLTAGATTLDSVGVTNDATVGGKLNVTGDTTLAKLTAGATTLESVEVTNNATVGGTLGVTGATTLGSTLNVTGLTTFGNDGFSLGGKTATAIDTGAAAITAGSATTLASTQTVLISAENATYTGNKINVKKDTIKEAIADLDTAIGDMSHFDDNNVATDKTNVAANITALDTAIGDLSELQNSQYIQPENDIATSLGALDGNLARVEHKVSRLENEVRGGFAAAAAMSALVPNARAAGDTQIAVGTGNYRDRVGFAVGAFHYINDNILVNAGAAYGGSKSTTFRAGVTFGW